MPGGPETLMTTGVRSSTQRSYADSADDELGFAADEGRRGAGVATAANRDRPTMEDAVRAQLEIEAAAGELGGRGVGDEAPSPASRASADA